MIPGLVEITLVAGGGAAGGAARYWVTGYVDGRVGTPFPWGTLTVNASGAFLLGLLAGAWSTPTALLQAPAGTLLAIGLLGSYTTVSAFSLQTMALARRGDTRGALINTIANVLGGLLLVALGYGAARLATGA